MTIIQITSILSGGAGQEVWDMHHALTKLGHNSYIINRGKYLISPEDKLSRFKNTSNYIGKFLRLIFRCLFKLIKINDIYAPYNLYERFLCYNAKKILQQLPSSPDLIFIKWASDFSNARFIADLRKFSNAKIIISLIDQAPLTAGCHYPNDCKQYMRGCTNCPMSTSFFFKWCIKRNFRYKLSYLPQDIFIWVASEGDKEIVNESLLYKNHQVIKRILTVDADLFSPINKSVAKSTFGIGNKKVILCGSTNILEPRKGIRYLIEAINKIKYENYVLLLVGNENIGEVNCEVIYTGYLTKERLINAYQAADVFVCPSIADSGPMMINQSMMMGTPVVSFPVGVSKDLVYSMKTGYLAQKCDAVDLARGIDIILSLSDDNYITMSQNCRNLAMELYNVNNSKYSLDNFIEHLMNI